MANHRKLAGGYASLVVVLVLQQLFSCCIGDCDPKKAGEEFFKKTIINRYPDFPNDPYSNQTSESLQKIKQVLEDRVMVCAIQYQDENKLKYKIQQFSSKEDAQSAGYIVTHQGRCGACSDLKDLAVYLTQTDLTTPIRQCGFKGVFSKKWAMNCIKENGFSDSCTQIWYYNTLNTRKECFWTCMWSWMTGEPFNKPDGSLNDCLQCDEDKSGPVFKFFAGRTRRNSGIHSGIHRPGSQVYNMTHCYY